METKESQVIVYLSICRGVGKRRKRLTEEVGFPVAGSDGQGILGVLYNTEWNKRRKIIKVKEKYSVVDKGGANEQ